MARSTPGYVLKVAVASASIGCATLAACDSHPVGTVASPPRPESTNTEVGTVAPAPDAAAAAAKTPDAPDAAATTKTADTPPDAGPKTPPPAPKPTGHKVGIIAAPPDLSPVVGTTAHAPDAPKP